MQFLDGQNSITLFKGYIQYIFTMFFFSLKENTFESWENVFYVTFDILILESNALAWNKFHWKTWKQMQTGNDIWPVYVKLQTEKTYQKLFFISKGHQFFIKNNQLLRLKSQGFYMTWKTYCQNVMFVLELNGCYLTDCCQGSLNCWRKSFFH